jgi:hypothetical protein
MTDQNYQARHLRNMAGPISAPGRSSRSDLLLQPRLKRQGLGIEGRLIGRGSSTLRLLLEVSSASRHSSIRCDECGVRTAPGSAESGADSEHSEHEE